MAVFHSRTTTRRVIFADHEVDFGPDGFYVTEDPYEIEVLSRTDGVAESTEERMKEAVKATKVSAKTGEVK